MGDNDLLIKPTQTEQLPSATSIFPETQIQEKAKEPSKFLRILGGIAGAATNLILPGMGGVVGSVIGGSGSTYGAYGSLLESNRQFDEMQKYTQLANQLQYRQQQAMMNQQQQQSFQLISVQQRVGMQAQEFTTVSNLMKTRHDSEMSAVNNIKS